MKLIDSCASHVYRRSQAGMGQRKLQNKLCFNAKAARKPHFSQMFTLRGQTFEQQQLPS